MSEPAAPEPVSEAASPTTVATATQPRTGAAAPEPGPPRAPKRRFRRSKSRQARVVIRKVGPWSVLKFSFLFYLCVMVVILGALVILYEVLQAVGALDSVTSLIQDLFADPDFEIHGDWLFSRAMTIGFGMVVLWTLINVFIAFLYNLISDIVGGIEVTLTERR
jgi:hypothetical protein